jgi:hypothetical protein
MKLGYLKYVRSAIELVFQINLFFIYEDHKLKHVAI